MATTYPVILNGVRFQVNPQSLDISKAVKYGTLETQNGVVYQFWYNNPEVLRINGISAGTSAFQELISLRNNYDVTLNPGKISQLFYKSKTYNGFLANLTVNHTISNGTHLMFKYTLTFQLLQNEEFKFEDFALQPTGVLGQATTIFSQTINQPIAGFENKINQIVGKTIG
jgi:hypothetical protein